MDDVSRGLVCPGSLLTLKGWDPNTSHPQPTQRHEHQRKRPETVQSLTSRALDVTVPKQALGAWAGTASQHPRMAVLTSEYSSHSLRHKSEPYIQSYDNPDIHTIL